MLDKLDLAEVYDSEDRDLVQDLQVPLLASSTSYLRGVGYFTSGWMRLASQGLQGLAENGGRARIVVSPILEADDWQAMQLGQDAEKKSSLYRSLLIGVQDIAEHLERDTRNALAWMVADRIVEFRFAVERSRSLGDYHDKVAIFADVVGNEVAIHGSFNDSVKATYNGEAFSVFRSWSEGQAPFVYQHRQRLERLWAGNNAQFETLNIPEAIRDAIVKLRDNGVRPYSTRSQNNPARGSEAGAAQRVVLRSYQQTAIDRWRAAGYRGIWEMATGTGKTVTALAAAEISFKECGTRLAVILVPYLHLMEQWQEDARKFGLRPLLCSGENPDWPKALRSLLIDAAMPSGSMSCVIAVHDTAATDRFINLITRCRGEQLLLIADEAHGLGARRLRRALYDGAALRLGLSATPNRWFDDEGTSYLTSYFNGVCFELPIESAIGKILTPYKYYPRLVSLTTSEQLEYAGLSKQIAAILARREERQADKLKMLLLRRARVIAGASDKLEALLETVDNHCFGASKTLEELRDILIYAPAGHHKEYLAAMSNKGLRCHEFVHNVTVSRREEVLREFAAGQIQALVAVKCLDEGVDVPSTRVAFILASSTNPREFVQRRGRILRKSEGKSEAVVYDFLVAPHAGDEPCSDTDRSLLRREMPRFAEFASSASNEFEARSVIRPVLDRCEMIPLLDKRPWDVYKEMKEAEWELENA